GAQRGQPRAPEAGSSPGGPRDVLRTSGAKVINSPGTAINAGPFASTNGGTAPTAPLVQSPTYVGVNDQRLSAIVVTGLPGSTVQITYTDGVRSVSGGGTIGPSGALSTRIDVSTLRDGTLTVTATV